MNNILCQIVESLGDMAYWLGVGVLIGVGVAIGEHFVKGWIL